MLAYLAAQVRDIKLISAVNLLPLHKPMDIAEQYAASDDMTGGNIIIGTGIGSRDVEFMSMARQWRSVKPFRGKS